MENLKNNCKKIWSWVKQNPWTCVVTGTLALLSVAEGVLVLNANERIKDLENKNQSLEKENLDLIGQVRECEKVNRQLSRENGNLNYQLGKMVAVAGKTKN